ncbi:hypothetical protein Lal_00049538 [Lupinus albus]|nr:hypothetical protein Lal_00049538 [Lupinus albus]
MGQGQNSEGIKLFGTTITLHGKQRSEDKKVSEDGIEEKKPYLVQDARAWKQTGGALRESGQAVERQNHLVGLWKVDSIIKSTVHKFGMHEGLVLDEWQVATVVHGDYRELFPLKRQRMGSSGSGQPC